MRADLLKDRIDKEGLSLNDVAKKSGIDKATVSRVLTGKTDACSVETARKLIKGLNINNHDAIQIFFGE